MKKTYETATICPYNPNTGFDSQSDADELEYITLFNENNISVINEGLIPLGENSENDRPFFRRQCLTSLKLEPGLLIWNTLFTINFIMQTSLYSSLFILDV